MIVYIVGAAVVSVTLAYIYLFTPNSKNNFTRSLPKPNTTPKAGECIPRINPWFGSKGIIRFPEPDIQTAYDAFEKGCALYGSRNCLGVRSVLKKVIEEKIVDGKKKQFEFPQLGKFRWLTYSQVHEKARNFGCGLLAAGMKPKDFLAIYEDTRMEWTLAMRGAFTQSIVVFTVYANLGEEALIYALGQGEITHIVTNGASLKMVAKVKKAGVSSISTVIYTDTATQQDMDLCKTLNIKVWSFKEIEDMGASAKVPPTPPKVDDLACIMYTSGSTGVPKGVMTSHGNIIGMAAAIHHQFDINENDVFLHYLPLAHSMAFSAESVLLYKGVALGYGNPRTLTSTGVRDCEGDLKELSPTILVAVPTIFERIMHGVNALIKKESKAKQRVFEFALKQQIQAVRTGNRSSVIWNMLVFKKLRLKMGINNIRLMLTGSAPLSAKVHDWVRAVFGAPLMQGYGLTETNSAGTMQSVEDVSNEEIGAPLPCSEWKLVDVPEMKYTTSNNPPQGEVYLRGSTITMGYYKDPSKTKEAYFPEGDYSWFATGDIGQLQPNGALKIIDRKKNLIKPKHGEYIAVEKLESCYKTCPWLAFLMVYVDGTQFHCVLLGVPNKLMLQAWAKESGIADHEDWTKLCQDKKARDKVLQEVQAAAQDNKLRSIEVVRNVFLLPDEWTPENEMLTAAMKLNRTIVVKKYKHVIDKMYEELEKQEQH